MQKEISELIQQRDLAQTQIEDFLKSAAEHQSEQSVFGAFRN